MAEPAGGGGVPVALRRARVAINGEWRVGNVGRPSSGRVIANHSALFGNSYKSQG